MSVINQMLKDLEKQDQVNVSIAEESPVNLANDRKYNGLIIGLSLAITTITASAGFMFWQKYSEVELPAVVHSRQVIPDHVTETVKAIKTENETIAVVKPEVEEATTLQSKIQQPKVQDVIVQESIIQQSIIQQSIVQPLATQTVSSQIVATPAKNSDTETFQPTETHVKSQPAEKIVDTQVSITATPIVAEKATKTPVKVVAKQVVIEDPINVPDVLVEPQVVIKKIARTPAQRAKLYQREAEEALLTGDTEKAKQRFQQVLSLQANHNSAREQLAAILFGEKRTQSAVNLLQQGLSISPEHANFRLMLARIYMKNNDKKQAYYYLKPYHPEISDNFDYYALLAGLAQNLADLDVALMAYSKLTNADPNRAKWWLGLGITADKLQRTSFALSAYKTAQSMGQLSAASRKYIDTRIALLEK